MDCDRIVRWCDLGVADPSVNKEDFAKQGNETQALLFVDGTYRKSFLSRDGQCAEYYLLTSTSWVNAIERAIKRANSPKREPSSFMIVINRTPCNGRKGGLTGRGGCSGKLTSELVWLRGALTEPDHFDEMFQFTLACTGYYDGPDQEEKPMYGMWTTNYDLLAMERAGWQLKVLQVGEGLTRRGRRLRTWANEIEKGQHLIPDDRHPFVKQRFDKYMEQAMKWKPRARIYTTMKQPDPCGS